MPGSQHKTWAKIKAGSRNNIHFDEFTSLIEAFDFTLRNITGSHRNFVHQNIPGVLSVQPDKNNQAKSYQIRQLEALVKKYNLTLV